MIRYIKINPHERGLLFREGDFKAQTTERYAVAFTVIAIAVTRKIQLCLRK